MKCLQCLQIKYELHNLDQLNMGCRSLCQDLDTSFCIPYLIDQGYEVHTLFVNTGGISSKEESAITKRANELGAKKHININVEKSLWP